MRSLAAWLSFWLLLPAVARAHFGMVIAHPPLVPGPERQIVLFLGFGHPATGVGLDLARPAHLTVSSKAGSVDLTTNLTPCRFMTHQGYRATYRIPRPGVYTFVMEPQPYWEPTENQFILHITKTVVPAFGAEDGWDRPVGLPVEIVPLVRPFGNYAGNTFVGQVLVHGQAAAHIPVEVERYNQDHLTPPSPWHQSQQVRTNANGIFVFTCPLPGWWGFAALTTDDRPRTGPDGQPKSTELGAVFWSYFSPLPTPSP